jgi:transposase-like protein
MTADLDNPIFTDADKAREALEAVRWPNGPVCPHCGSVERIAKVEGTKKSHRPGLYFCNACQGQFTVTVGTVFEDSKVPLNKWWMAVYLLSSSKKGISSHQLHRSLGVSYKTAWFMSHRIREAMRDGTLAPFGGGDGVYGIVEADETFIGREPGIPKKRGYHHKMKVLSLVDREAGKARSIVVDDLSAKTLVPILEENIAKEATVMTDEAGQYGKLGEVFIEHQSVAHSQDEYVRGIVHTNTVEGYFSVFKRGMKGIYQHCGKKHLHRYLAEFDFRYNNRIALGVNDSERTTKAMAGIEGKRLTYRRTDEARL